MKNNLPEVDHYIEQSADFAKPILKRLRKLFHKASPTLREEMKWGAPHFVGQRIVGMIAAFKQHVSWGFWNAKSLPDPHGLLKASAALTSFGFKPRCLADLPPDDVLLDYIRAAVELDQQGATRPATKRKPPTLKVPKDLREALKQSPAALSMFESFSPSHRREYIEWITEAKRQETRERRIATTLEWLINGKSRNWKYEPKEAAKASK